MASSIFQKREFWKTPKVNRLQYDIRNCTFCELCISDEYFEVAFRITLYFNIFEKYFKSEQYILIKM